MGCRGPALFPPPRTLVIATRIVWRAVSSVMSLVRSLLLLLPSLLLCSPQARFAIALGAVMLPTTQSQTLFNIKDPCFCHRYDGAFFLVLILVFKLGLILVPILCHCHCTPNLVMTAVSVIVDMGKESNWQNFRGDMNIALYREWSEHAHFHRWKQRRFWLHLLKMECWHHFILHVLLFLFVAGPCRWDGLDSKCSWRVCWVSRSWTQLHPQ